MTPNQEQLVYWITERNNIRLKKEQGLPAPWSDNEVMQVTYFCNVNREDDKVTKWIRDNWKYSNAPEYYDFAMMVARIFNLPDTLEELCQPLDTHFWLENAADILYDRQMDDKRIWNGAYIISTNGKKMDKVTYCLELLKKASKDPNPTAMCDTLDEAHKELMKVEGFASFLAGQVVADLRNSVGHPLYTVPDKNTFSAPGPGSLRGLEWFWEEKVTSKNYHKKIQDAYDIIEFELSDDIVDILSMQNLQNCFCEYDKFMRVTNKTGRSKRKYNGRGK